MTGRRDSPIVPKRQKASRGGVARFRPRARILTTIGSELISSEVVAVLELVRNAYDADATRVEIAFCNTHEPAACTLKIRDNGHGMTQEVLLGPWLEPATGHKSTEAGSGLSAGPRSPRGRRRLGSKGVGRFAAQRLGGLLEVTTRTQVRSARETSMSFDWVELLASGDYLDQLEVPWEEHIHPELQEAGTILTIHRLRDAWTEDAFERLRIALSRLVSADDSPDLFEITLTIDSASEHLRPALSQIDPMYAITGCVDENGVAHISYADMLGSSENWDRPVASQSSESCGPFSFRINAWDLDRPALERYLRIAASPLGIRDFRRVLRNNAGISLYRDGFRILPYGEPDNDWLRLDRRRVNNPTMRLSNNQVLGAVQLQADRNALLVDQTNREGLLANNAYRHLQHVVLDLLTYLEQRRFAARRHFAASSTSKVTGLARALSSELPDLTDLFDTISTSESGRTEFNNRVRSVFEAQSRVLAEVTRRYTSLATAGKLSALVFGQLRHPIRRLESELRLLATELTDYDQPDVAELKNRAARAEEVLRDLSQRMTRLDSLATGSRNGRPAPTDLRVAVSEVLIAFSDTFMAAGIAVVHEPGPTVVLETVGSALQQALATVLENAIFWAGQAERSTPRVIRVETESDSIRVWNSGPPIPEEHIRSVFEPHFTLRKDAHGLGLTLARDLIQHLGGRILVENRNQGVEFLLQLSPGKES